MNFLFLKGRPSFLEKSGYPFDAPALRWWGVSRGPFLNPPPFAINLYAILIRCASTFHETLSQPLRA